MKIKTWKVSEIMTSMSKYGDRYNVNVKGHQFGQYFGENADENGFVTVTNVEGIEKETEKALLINIDGFKTWCPKSAVVID